MEGLRLGTLLNQLQALQAIQGLQELVPKGKGKKRRFTFSEDQEERARQRQWLTFKADWLEALLEDTVDELEVLNQYEGLEGVKAKLERRMYTRQLIEIPASYEITIDGSDPAWKSCKVLDISPGGLRLFSQDQIIARADLKVTFEEGTNFAGVVMWSGKIQDKTSYHTGVRFRERQDIDVIEHEIKKLIGK